ncbi:MAG: hypothetical protein JRI83_13435 [Deltaproteobacteria bacterium]|nr:hypothetical protein [Deltaproteobacteria bacterium]MBW2133576.1 hypothetical protein [Deltaproteobacteria bacterium]
MDNHELDFRIKHLLDALTSIRRGLDRLSDKCDNLQARLDKLEKRPSVFPIIIDPSAQGCDREPLTPVGK